MNRTAEVRLSGQTVGFLTEDNGRTSFKYTAEWLARSDAQPVSLTLPLRPEPYEYDGLHPFFDNLLPEGWFLNVVCAKLKISKEDRFGILVGTCADCVGAIEVFPVASPSSSDAVNR